MALNKIQKLFQFFALMIDFATSLKSNKKANLWRSSSSDSLALFYGNTLFLLLQNRRNCYWNFGSVVRNSFFNGTLHSRKTWV